MSNNGLKLSLTYHLVLTIIITILSINTRSNQTRDIQVQIVYKLPSVVKQKEGKNKKGILSTKPKYRKVAHAGIVQKRKGKKIGADKKTKITNSLTGKKEKNKQTLDKTTQERKGGKVVDSFPTKSIIINPLKNLQNVTKKTNIDTSKLKLNPLKIEEDQLIEENLTNKKHHLNSYEISYVKQTISRHWKMLSGQQNYSSVTLLLHLDITGYINKVEVKRSANITSKEYNLMEANAISAIKSIKSLNLPKEKYKAWKYIAVTFNPKELQR